MRQINVDGFVDLTATSAIMFRSARADNNAWTSKKSAPKTTMRPKPRRTDNELSRLNRHWQQFPRIGRRPARCAELTKSGARLHRDVRPNCGFRAGHAANAATGSISLLGNRFPTRRRCCRHRRVTGRGHRAHAHWRGNYRIASENHRGGCPVENPTSTFQ